MSFWLLGRVFIFKVHFLENIISEGYALKESNIIGKKMRK